MSMETEISQIKTAIVGHNKDDDERFSAVLRKLDENHDVHIRNEEILRQILEQATKTNGRVTSLEDMCVKLDKSNAILHQIVSQQHNQYEKFVTQQERLNSNQDDRLVTKTEFAPVKGFVYAIISIICTGVLVGLLTVIIK